MVGPKLLNRVQVLSQLHNLVGIHSVWPLRSSTDFLSQKLQDFVPRKAHGMMSTTTLQSSVATHVIWLSYLKSIYLISPKRKWKLVFNILKMPILFGKNFTLGFNKNTAGVTFSRTIRSAVCAPTKALSIECVVAWFHSIDYNTSAATPKIS